MTSQENFNNLVADAYHHLYDIVYLRSHPLAQLLGDVPSLSAKEQGWRLHQLLLNIIDELSPDVNTPVQSREWRRHRLLIMRYIDGLDAQEVAKKLALSRRQYYREQAWALEALAKILWSQRQPEKTVVVLNPGDSLLNSEMTRLAASDSHADLTEVVNGVLLLLDRLLKAKHLRVYAELSDAFPSVSAGRALLRQVFMSFFGNLIANAADSELHLTVQTGDDFHLVLVVSIDPALALSSTQCADWLTEINQMLRIGHGELRAHWDGKCVSAFHLFLRIDRESTVLVVDDSADMLAFYERCLAPNGYQVRVTQNARAALEIVQETQPFCILLDLMLPDYDGWELLQSLLSHASTSMCPVIICSVLKQRDLALALGATAFLVKPFTEQMLLNTLNDLKARSPDNISP